MVLLDCEIRTIHSQTFIQYLVFATHCAWYLLHIVPAVGIVIRWGSGIDSLKGSGALKANNYDIQ